MKAILIDPMFNTIKEVQYDGDYKSIYRLIGYSFTKYQPPPKKESEWQDDY